MASDLAFPIEVIGHHTIREPDGLALSSRNTYLSRQDREKAPRLYRALQEISAAIRSGAPAEATVAKAESELIEAGFLIDYVKIRNAKTLAHVDDPKSEPMRVLAAVWLGKTRLIDNVAV
jgi:pantoate--beta-alanine ligase